MYKSTQYILLMFLSISASSCEKFLDAKPDESLAVPSDKLTYLQLLLEDTGSMNQFNPAAGDIASDDALVPPAVWNNLLQAQRTSANAYIWEKDMFNDSDRNSWSAPYKQVLNANLVLDGLGNFSPGSTEWNNLKGAALFFRSYGFFNLLQEFALAYNESSASMRPGIVLKLNADISQKVSRATIKESYAQLTSDLEESLTLLPETVSYKTRPSRAAAYALLARTYLILRDFNKAAQYAEEALKRNNKLMDFKKLNAALAYPVAMFNEEVVFQSNMTALSGVSATYGRVSPDLFNLYHTDDLRKTIFYSKVGNDVFFKGSYFGSNTRFSGLATDEVYLIAAEAHARTANLPRATELLNLLLEKRYAQGKFIPLQFSGPDAALDRIIQERRKELAFRNLRWSDLKRLNEEDRFKKTIVHEANNTFYKLEPGDSRYAFPIPLNVIAASGIPQN